MFVVIMAGGFGTRFWPAGRERRPKQFLDIVGSGPMVLAAIDRLKGFARDGEILLVIEAIHKPEARRLLKGRCIDFVAEPFPRNTAACIGLGALAALRAGHAEPVVFLPADHAVADSRAFIAALKKAFDCARGGGIATLGITPTRPETGYGYIRAVPGANGVGKATAFIEKPDRQTAERLLTEGDCFWNAGIFVARPDVFLSEIERHVPRLARAFAPLARAKNRRTADAALGRAYRNIESVSFDKGVMEKTGSPIHVIPCDCGWSDVGSWNSLYELLKPKRDARGNLATGDAILIDCEGSFVAEKGKRLVACLGMKDCIVIDTGDAVLVADMRKSGDICKIVSELKQKRYAKFR